MLRKIGNSAYMIEKELFLCLIFKMAILKDLDFFRSPESENFSYSGLSVRGSVGVCWLVLGFESNCPLVGPGTIGGVLSVGVFLRDPSPYLGEFRRKPLKTPNG